jgi:signal transduction histidine kinase
LALERAQFPVVTRETEPASRPAWLLPAAAWAGVLLLALALGLYAHPLAPPVQPGMGPVFPRIPVPPDFRTLLSMLGVGSVVWYAVFLALPPLLWLARRTDVEAHSPLKTVSVSAVAVSALVVVTSFIQYSIVYAGAPGNPSFGEYLPTALRQNLLPWLALAGIVIAVESRRRAVRLAVERERLRREVAEQRLISLTAQLQPHFLFNTLQGISTLIHRDADAADEMLGKLADLLRDVLRDRDRVLVSLGDEIRYARTYLEIASLRFADRLSYSIDVPPDLEHSEVPLFVLQPLLENALNHGIGSQMRGGKIEIRAARSGDRLILEVLDDGAGLGANATDRIGITNTRERLAASFGSNHQFTLAPRSDGGTVARIDVPMTSAR